MQVAGVDPTGANLSGMSQTPCLASVSIYIIYNFTWTCDTSIQTNVRKQWNVMQCDVVSVLSLHYIIYKHLQCVYI